MYGVCHVYANFGGSRHYEGGVSRITRVWFDGHT